MQTDQILDAGMQRPASLDIESIKKIYGGYSGLYDALFKRFFFPRIKSAISTMAIKPGERILDLGVGTGLSFSEFPSHCKVIGIDISAQMLKQARQKISEKRFHNIKLLGMDAMRCGFLDNSFDKVFISHVVSVVPDPYSMMEEAKRVCRPGGDIVVVNHFRSSNRLIEKVERIINPMCKRIGWRSDMCLNEFIGTSGINVNHIYTLKKLDFWHIIFATNVKN